MIELEIPVEKIPFARTIEGRKFKDGKWLFPSTSIDKLQKLGLVEENFIVSKKEIIQYNLSQHLRQYQKDIVSNALNEGSFAIFADTGTGKSNIGIEIASHLGKTIVLCPLSVIETAWIDDCNQFFPQLKITNVWGNSKEQRLENLKTNSDIYVMNYESFKIIRNEIKNMGIQCLIVDESSVMKNMKSQITSIILETIDYIPHRFVLSGCPTPNSNEEIFPQMKLIDSDIFGNNFHGFRARYFHQDMVNPHRWYQTDEDKDSYFNRLRNKSVFLRKEDCVDLPEKIFETKKFELDKTQREYYNDFVENIREHINEWSKFEFTAKLMKLREITSGFIINKDKTIMEFKTNKDKILEETLSEISNDKQVIIWCQFIYEIEKLSKMFNGVGLTSKTKNRDEIIKKFKNGEIKLLFAHPQLLGKGLTFTKCTYNIYYSLSFSYEEFKQSQDRIHRIGQTNKCTYIILQGRNTIDEKIYKCLINKGNTVNELYLEMGKEVDS
ncbi:MAG: DEAD/DEAH box helicase [Malacoplasma sp.]